MCNFALFWNLEFQTSLGTSIMLFFKRLKLYIYFFRSVKTGTTSIAEYVIKSKPVCCHGEIEINATSCITGIIEFQSMDVYLLNTFIA